MFDAAVILLHALVLVYWLGGDLGAFYGSGFMTDPRRSLAERLMALKLLNDIDMAPRTALILAFPTGFAAAWTRGWLMVPGWSVALVWIAGLVWLALAWGVHLKHGASGAGLKRIDIAVRYVVLIALAGSGIAGLIGALEIPLFIACKLLILAGCISLGLLVRRQLVPLFPAIVAMKENGATPETDRQIRAVIQKTRPSVMSIWALILVAALLGLATPV